MNPGRLPPYHAGHCFPVYQYLPRWLPQRLRLACSPMTAMTSPASLQSWCSESSWYLCWLTSSMLTGSSVAMCPSWPWHSLTSSPLNWRSTSRPRHWGGPYVSAPPIPGRPFRAWTNSSCAWGLLLPPLTPDFPQPSLRRNEAEVPRHWVYIFGRLCLNSNMSMFLSLYLVLSLCLSCFVLATLPSVLILIDNFSLPSLCI